MIIGICIGTRASAPRRIGNGLSDHSRHMLILAGSTAMNNATAAVAPNRRVRGATSRPAVASSATPEA